MRRRKATGVAALALGAVLLVAGLVDYAPRPAPAPNPAHPPAPAADRPWWTQT